MDAIPEAKKKSAPDPMITYFSEMSAIPLMSFEQEVQSFSFVEKAESDLVRHMLSNGWFSKEALKDLVASIGESGIEAHGLDKLVLDPLGQGFAPMIRVIRFSEPGRDWYGRTYLKAVDPDRMRKAGVGGEAFRKWKGKLESLHGAQHEAKCACVSSNLRLVVAIAKKYSRSSSTMTLNDTIQEGNIGLMKAVERFDVGRGYRFSTYASLWIRANIKRASADKESLVRVPVHLADRIQQISRAEGQFSLRYGRSPTTAELAKETGIPADKVLSAIDSRIRGTVSFDAPISDLDHDATLQDVIPDPAVRPADEQLHSERRDATVWELLQYLTPQESQILRWRFGMEDEEKTLKEIGDIMGLSRERIRQLESRALSKLKDKREAVSYRV